MPISRVFFFLLLLPISRVHSFGQTKIDVQEIKKLESDGSLSTCGYLPIEREKEFHQKLSPAEKVTGSFTDEHEYRIQGKAKQYVSWFGVVRRQWTDDDVHSRNLLIQHKFFDGMTDCHIMLVSNSGAGDFVAKLVSVDKPVPLLSLVRVYGTVTKDENKVPQVSADYVRVWPWFTFTFTDLGPADRSNPEWAKYCKLCKHGRIYKPYPTEDYYREILGDPKDFLPIPPQEN